MIRCCTANLCVLKCCRTEERMDGNLYIVSISGGRLVILLTCAFSVKAAKLQKVISS